VTRFFAALILCSSFAFTQELQRPVLEVKSPPLVLSGVNFTLEVVAKDSAGDIVTSFFESAIVQGVKQERAAGQVSFSGGRLVLDDALFAESGTHEITVEAG